MLDYESVTEHDEWRSVRGVLCYVCFVFPVAVVRWLRLQQEWVDAGSPSSGRPVSEFFAAVLIVGVVALIEGGILLAAVAIWSWGRFRLRKLYPLWMIAGGAIYPLLGVILSKAARGVADEAWTIVASVIYTLAYPVALGLLVIARRPAHV